MRNGRSTNCGCVRMEKMRQASIKDETGKIYGHLKVLRQATKEEKYRQDRTGIYWVCECLNCGNKHFIVFGDYLRNGDTTSCGCINSKNESRIAQILNELNLKYKQQYPYRDLYFDFAIYSNSNELLYIIEYDGIQHFKEISFFNIDLDTQKYRDEYKNQWCKDNDIPIIRIPYTKLKSIKITDLLLETSEYII